ncbi:MAG: SDR family NAD(P)-dependent oxidoreductase [Mariniphaga sp.]|jgi:NAD(P)-dependent dehydrogenase (short-subunit alcohol dehydrogenase family)|nr:SDR family NAD(P)-dependent oxidoreductase [Mariniphaga sp.]
MQKSFEKQVVFFTGGTSGLGREAVLALALNGAKVVVIARNKAKGDELLKTFHAKQANSKGEIQLIECDLSSINSIQTAVNKFKIANKRLDILVNNAAVWKVKFTETADGIEEAFQVNVLAPYLLSQLLADWLEKSDHAKIINTASYLHQGNIQFEDIEFRKNYKSFNVYKQSKLAVILLTRQLAQQFSSRGIGVYCFHPGLVRTELARETSFIMRSMFWLPGISAKKGAQTLIFLAREDKEKLVSGEYYHKMKIGKSSPQSKNMEFADRLVQHIEKMELPVLSE